MSTPVEPLTSSVPSAADPLLRTVIEASPLAIHLLDSAGRVRLWNPAAERIFGWRAAEVIGLPDPTITSLADEQRMFTSVLESGVPVEKEVIRADRDGNCIEIALSMALVPDSVGGARGVMAIAADITDRRRLERELNLLLDFERTARAEAEASERRARFLAESSALLDSSLDYLATLNNLARLAVPGLADYCLIDELEGDTVSRVALAHVDPEGEKILHRKIRQPLAGDPAKHPVVRVMLTGESVLVEVADDAVLREISHSSTHLARLRKLQLHSFIIVPLGGRGRILGAITLAFAESKRRYTAADLQMAEEVARRAGAAVEAARLYRESRRAVQARERLMTVVSHDLRNSLATVLLNSSAILESDGAAKLDRPLLDQLQWIARSAEQMNRLISDLLDVSAIELGRFSLDPSPQPVGCLLSDAALMHRPLCDEKAIHFTVSVPEGLPQVIVDAERFHQVVGNLLGNAIKFSPEGTTIGLAAYQSSAAEVCFSVTDEGPGIEPQHLRSIFEMYWQGSTGRRSGAGIGLGIAKAIVEGHGGRIWVESSPGAGSTFTFTIPAFSGDASPAEETGHHDRIDPARPDDGGTTA